MAAHILSRDELLAAFGNPKPKHSRAKLERHHKAAVIHVRRMDDILECQRLNRLSR